MNNELARWGLTGEFDRMRRIMDRLWADVPLVTRENVAFSTIDELLPVDIFDNEGKVVVKTALPGVKPEDIDVHVSDGVLHIRAETKAEEDIDEASYLRRECRYGKYYRSFTLPPNLDTENVTAHYDSGMLRLTFPKTEAAKDRSIQVTVK